MDWSSLKNLMISGQERFIIVENDTPEFVVLSLEEYQRLVQGHDIVPPQEANDQLQDITPIEPREQGMPLSPSATGVVAPVRFGEEGYGTIRLEDLPL